MNVWYLPQVPKEVVDFVYVDLDGVTADFVRGMEHRGCSDPKIY